MTADNLQYELNNLAAHLESDGDLEGAELATSASVRIGLLMHALWIMLDGKEVVVRAATGPKALSISTLDSDDPAFLIKQAT